MASITDKISPMPVRTIASAPALRRWLAAEAKNPANGNPSKMVSSVEKTGGSWMGI
ncbi:hypothetical protein GCM10028773_03750 [Spirosoma koreense]